MMTMTMDDDDSTRETQQHRWISTSLRSFNAIVLCIVVLIFIVVQDVMLGGSSSNSLDGQLSSSSLQGDTTTTTTISIYNNKDYDSSSLKELYRICVPHHHGDDDDDDSSSFDEIQFQHWLASSYAKGLEDMKNDHDFLNCAALRLYQLQLHQTQTQQNQDTKSMMMLRQSSSTPNNSKQQQKQRPKAILHVGPRRTGSSAIQRAMRKVYANELEQDENNNNNINYVVIVNASRLLVHCAMFHEPLPSSGENCTLVEEESSNTSSSSSTLQGMKRSIAMARNDGKNILLSSESLDQIRQVDPTKIQQLLDGFDIHVVVVYRRFYEWIASRFEEKYRTTLNWNEWHDHGDDDDDGMKSKADNKNIVAAITSKSLKAAYVRYYSLEVYHMYRQAGFSTHILNYHQHNDDGEEQVVDIVESFFCLDVLNTTSICELERQGKPVRAKDTEGASAFDEIAVAAKEGGLLDEDETTTNKNLLLTRPQARESIRRYFEETLGLSVSDLPRVCMQQRELDLLKNISVMSEESLFGRGSGGGIEEVPEFFYDRRPHDEEMEIVARFEDYKESHFCAVDTKKVLEVHGAAIRSVLLGGGEEEEAPPMANGLPFEEVPGGTFRTYDMEHMYKACVPLDDGESLQSRVYDEKKFLDWLEHYPRGMENRKNDADYVNCATLRFQHVLSQSKVEDDIQSIHPESTSTITQERPKVIIHIGPRKTGSSSIQRAMKKTYIEELQRQNYSVIVEESRLLVYCEMFHEPHDEWVRACEDESSKASLEDMKRTIASAREEGKHVLISSESLDQVRHVNHVKIKQLFHGFDIHVVVAYRRFFEWMVSKFGERYRSGLNWDEWQYIQPVDKNVVANLSPWEIKASYIRYYSMEAYRLYRQAGFTTHMLNFHADGDVVKSIFCLDVLNTKDICELESLRGAAVRANTARPIAYDEIGVAAKEEGLVSSSLNLTRPEVRESIQRYFEETLEQTTDDLPKMCVQERELNLLEALSTMSESHGVPEYYNLVGENALATRFETYKSTKFCAVDTRKVLDEHGSSLQTVFSDLKNKDQN